MSGHSRPSLCLHFLGSCPFPLKPFLKQCLLCFAAWIVWVLVQALPLMQSSLETQFPIHLLKKPKELELNSNLG
jgi:hypothetical protein